MGKNKTKGDQYEDFSQEVLLLQQLNWSYDKNNKDIKFDVDTGEHVIYGISGAHHQIDIHLTSTLKPDIHLLCECKSHEKGVEKTHACSFVTVINDIKELHIDWKVIPVFAADDGFNSGALTILNYYKIIALEMKDYRNATRTLTTKMTSTAPIFSELYGVLDDGTLVDRKSYFRNNSRGGYLGITNAIGSFEILDDSESEIEDIVFYVGNFHTGKRIVVYDEYDDFYEMKTGKKLVSIRGTVTGNSSSHMGTDITVFKSKVITSIILGDGNIYKIMKDGTCEIVENKDDAKRIF